MIERPEAVRRLPHWKVYCVNPFTKALMKRLSDRELEAFVMTWDAIEALVVQVYKRGEASRNELVEYGRLRAWFREEYPRWRNGLRPHWERASIGGKPAQSDPFDDLMALPGAAHFVDNWKAMQTLPAAREALNEFLLEKVEASRTDTGRPQ